MKLEINNRKKMGKFRNLWKLNNTLLSNQWINKEITREIRKYLETNEKENITYKSLWRTSLVVQWLRICLPMQGTRVQSPVREDPTCHGATKPMHHNYWACAPQLLKPVHPRARIPQLLSLLAATTEAWCLEPLPCNKRSHHNEKPAHCNKE